MNQISLKELNFHSSKTYVPFITYPGAVDCLRNLSELNCSSSTFVYPEFFSQMSQICHNIRSLKIRCNKNVSEGLLDLISVQQNLKYLGIFRNYYCKGYEGMILSIEKLPNTLTKLEIDEHRRDLPLSFIAKFTNLQELVLSINENSFEWFEKLQHVTFPQLHLLKFKRGRPKPEYLIKFLENNGRDLEEFYVHNVDCSLNLVVAKSCPNMKSLSVISLDDDNIETLKAILMNCQQLESIGVTNDERETLKTVTEYSPKGFYELKIHYVKDSQLTSEELESFFMNWRNRRSGKSLSLILFNKFFVSLDVKKENMDVIKKHTKLGIIKEVKVKKNDGLKIIVINK